MVHRAANSAKGGRTTEIPHRVDRRPDVRYSTAVSDELQSEGFRRACSVDEVGQAMPRRVEIGDRSVLLCRDGEKIFAVDEICPHENQSMRYGVVFGGRIICPHHHYAFRLEDGHPNRRRCAPLETYEVVVEDDVVWVRAG